MDKDIEEMIGDTSEKFGNIKRYVGDLKFYVLCGLLAATLINLVTNGITIYLYYYAARPMAQAAYKGIRAREKSLDYREMNLDLRERKMDKRDDTLKAKELLYGFYELYNQ